MSRQRSTALFEDLHVLGLLCGSSVLLLAWGYPLWGGAWQAFCPLLEITGIPCPTCYGTRALLAAARGDWLAAVRLNPLVAFGGISLFAYLPWAAGAVVGGWRRPSLSFFASAKAARLGVGLVLANWSYLLIAHS